MTWLVVVVELNLSNRYVIFFCLRFVKHILLIYYYIIYLTKTLEWFIGGSVVGSKQRVQRS